MLCQTQYWQWRWALYNQNHFISLSNKLASFILVQPQGEKFPPLLRIRLPTHVVQPYSVNLINLIKLSDSESDDKNWWKRLALDGWATKDKISLLFFQHGTRQLGKLVDLYDSSFLLNHSWFVTSMAWLTEVFLWYYNVALSSCNFCIDLRTGSPSYCH